MQQCLLQCCYSKKKKMYGSGPQATVKFSNEDINNMTKIVKALEDSDVLIKGVTKTLKNDIKKGVALRMIPMLLRTLGASLLTGRGLFRAGSVINVIVEKECIELDQEEKDYLEQDSELKKNH